MLTCKSLVTINPEKGEPIFVEYDRNYLDFAASDEVENISKTNKGKDVLVNGVKWVGTAPKNKTTAKTDAESVGLMQSEAMNQLVKDWGETATFKALPNETKAVLILLAAADYGADLWKRARIQSENRPAKAQDPAEARDKAIKAIMADAASRGKTLTLEQATKRYERMKELEAEEEAETANA